MRKKERLFFLIVLLVAGCKPQTEEKELTTKRPNIIVILADDLGFSDIGSFGGEINTPNLDKLASNGVRATQFYSAARCCPTRASLMSGLFQHQAGMGHMSNGLKLLPDSSHIESYQGYLPENVPTIANLLSDAGYSTYISGKWHIGDDEKHHPHKQGFQKAAFLKHGSNYFTTDEYTMKMHFNDSIVQYDDTTQYMTNIITDNALDMINGTPEDSSFFLYLAYTAPHSPLQAPDSLIKKYMPTYADGWESLRKKRFEKQKELGLISREMETPGAESSFAGADYNWDNYSEDEKSFLQRIMATYAGMVDNMDQNIGRLIAHLEAKGELDNTIILFMSDNGATNESKPNRKLKNPGYEIPGSKYYQGAQGHWWAYLSNTPFRMFKAYANQGGISSPFIAYYPKGFGKGEIITDNYFHVMDIMPTCLELAGTQYPDVFNGKTTKTTYHKSLLPHLENLEPISSSDSSRVLCWAHQGHLGVRKGKWKMTHIREVYNWNPFEKKKIRQMINEWSLYDLEKDPFENNNVYDQYPQVVEELNRDYAQWAENTGVVPWDRVNIWHH